MWPVCACQQLSVHTCASLCVVYVYLCLSVSVCLCVARVCLPVSICLCVTCVGLPVSVCLSLCGLCVPACVCLCVACVWFMCAGPCMVHVHLPVAACVGEYSLFYLPFLQEISFAAILLVLRSEFRASNMLSKYYTLNPLVVEYGRFLEFL